MSTAEISRMRDFFHASNLKSDTKRFWHYRQKNTSYRAADYEGFFRGKYFPLKSVARGDRPDVAFPDADPAIYRRNNYYGNINIDDVPDPTSLQTPNALQAYNRVREVKDFFVTGDPKYEFIQTLGYGGNGVAVRYELQGLDEDNDDPNIIRDIAVKYPIRNWQSDSLRQEAEMTRKFHRAAHIIQTLAPEEIGGPPLDDFEKVKPVDDSSDSEESSGDEDISLRPVKIRKRRADLTDWELTLKRRKWNPPIQHPAHNRDQNRNRMDYMITEFAPRGSLVNFISLAYAKRTPIPVRVLWRLWLCLIKMATALAFPPRKFHPEWSATGTGDLDEVYPDDDEHYQRMKRYVHFDLDPTNIFVFDFEQNHEHEFAPKLKLADFGLCKEVKTQKRDVYYTNLRRQGKTGYYAPEQFTEEWDFLPPDRNGGNITTHRTLGNYGPHTNIWGIGNVMFNLITGFYPPVPPQAGNLDYRDSDGNLVHGITYGAALTASNQFDRVPLELRAMVARCMAHEPGDRPDVRELMRHAQRGLNDSTAAETDDEVMRFHWGLFDGPTSPSPGSPSSSSQSDGGAPLAGSGPRGPGDQGPLATQNQDGTAVAILAGVSGAASAPTQLGLNPSNSNAGASAAFSGEGWSAPELGQNPLGASQGSGGQSSSVQSGLYPGVADPGAVSMLSGVPGGSSAPQPGANSSQGIQGSWGGYLG